MLPPHNRPISQLAKEEGISEATLYAWRSAERKAGRLLPNGDTTPEGWSASDKFAAVLETASLNESALSAWCRERGLYTEQIKQWRIACEQANDWDHAHNQQMKAARLEDGKKIKQLERELRQKEKALAETAALLVLRKKAQAIWGEPEGE